MSNIIIPDVAKIAVADVFAGINGFGEMKLFENDYVPAHGTTLLNLTEATFAGYAAQPIINPAVAGALDASFRAVISWDELTFTRTNAPNNTIYGYWVEDSNGDLLWVERFDNPVPVLVNGVFIALTPKFTIASQFLNT